MEYAALEQRPFVRAYFICAEQYFPLGFWKTLGLPFGNHNSVELILVSVDSAGGSKCQFLLYMPGLYGKTFFSYVWMSELS